MEILRIGDELSISGYNAITLSDNMDSNIAAFAQANGISQTEAARILNTHPALKNFAENLNSKDEEEDIVVTGDFVNDTATKTATTGKTVSTEKAEEATVISFGDTTNNVFATKTSSTKTDNNTKTTDTANKTKTSIANSTLSDIQNQISKLMKEMDNLSLQKYNAMMAEDDYKQYQIEQQQNLLNAQIKELKLKEAELKAKEEGRTFSAAESNLSTALFDMDFRVTRIKEQIKYLDLKEQSINQEIELAQKNQDDYAQYVLEQQQNAIASMRAVFEMELENIEKNQAELQEELNTLQEYATKYPKNTKGNKELQNIILKKMELSSQFTDIATQKATAMQNEDEYTQYQLEQQENKINEQLKELEVKQAKVMASMDGKKLSDEEISLIEQNFDIQVRLGRIQEQREYLNYKSIGISELKSTAMQNEDEQAQYVLEQQENAINAMDKIFEIEQTSIERVAIYTEQATKNLKNFKGTDTERQKLENVISDKLDVLMELLDLSSQKSTAMQTEDEYKQYQVEQEEEAAYAKLKALNVQEAAILDKTKSSADVQKESDKAQKIADLEDKLNSLSYKLISIADAKSAAMQNEDERAQYTLEQQEKQIFDLYDQFSAELDAVENDKVSTSNTGATTASTKATTKPDTVISDAKSTSSTDTSKTTTTNNTTTQYQTVVDENRKIQENEIIYAEGISTNSNALKNALGEFGFDVDTAVEQIMYNNDGSVKGFVLDGKTYTVKLHSNGQISEKRVIDANGDLVEVTQYREDGTIYDMASKEYQAAKNELVNKLWDIISPYLKSQTEAKEVFLETLEHTFIEYRDYILDDGNMIEQFLLYLHQEQITTGAVVQELDLTTKTGKRIRELCNELTTIMRAEDKNVGIKNPELKYEYKTVDGVNFKISYNKNTTPDYEIKKLADGSIEIKGNNCTVDLMGLGESNKKIKVSGDNITINSKNMTFNQIINNATNAKINGSHGDDTINNEGVGSTIQGLNGDDIITNNASNSNIQGNKGNDTIINNGKGATIDGGDGDDAINYIKNSAVINPSNGNDKLNEIDNTTQVPVPPPPTPKPGEWEYSKQFTVNGVTFTIYSNEEIPSEAPVSVYKNVLTFNISNCKIVINSTTKDDSSIKLIGASIEFETKAKLRAVFNHADNSKITGSGEQDYLYNYANNVTIAGMDGNDVICNEGDNTSIDGGSGSDRIRNREEADKAAIMDDSQDEIHDMGTNTIIGVTDKNNNNNNNDNNNNANNNNATAPTSLTAQIEQFRTSGNVGKLDLTENEMTAFVTKAGGQEKAAALLAQIDVIIGKGPEANKYMLSSLKDAMLDGNMAFNDEILADAQILIDAQKTTNPNEYIKKQLIKDGGSLTTAQMLSQTKAGEVVEKSGKLYVNDGSKMVQLDISAETYLELFPPVERYLVEQNSYNDCFFIATTMIDFMENDIARANLLQLFSEDANGNITVTFPGVADYPITFQNGQLKTTDSEFTQKQTTTNAFGQTITRDVTYSYQDTENGVVVDKATAGSTYDMTNTTGALGLQMLEQAYALAKFAQLSNTTIKSSDIDELGSALYYAAKDAKISAADASNVDIDKALTYYMYGGYAKDVYADLTENETIVDYQKFSNATSTEAKNILGTIKANMIAYPELVVTTLITGSKEISEEDAIKYNIISGHQYSIEDIDTVNQIVYVKNPWDSYKVVSIPFDKFIELFYGIAQSKIG